MNTYYNLLLINEGLKMVLRFLFLCSVIGMARGILERTVRAEVGENIRLPCRLPTDTADRVVSWYVGTKQLTMGLLVLHHSARLTVNKPAPGELNLNIKSVVKSDEDMYTCKTTNRTHASIQVRVEWEPDIDKTVSSKLQETTMEGATKQLKCVASGQPRPNITWYRRAQDQPNFQEIPVTGETLTIYNITRYGNDVYRCNASNAQGWKAWEMNVTVHFSPSVTIMESDQYVVSGYKGHVMMSCVIQGSPMYKYYWKFNNVEIKENWKYQIFRDHDLGYPVYFLTLMIRPRAMTNADFGTYTCHADGSGMEAEASISIKEKPKAVVTAQPSNGNTIRYN